MEANLVSLQRTLYESRNPTRRWLHTTRRDWISEAIRKFGKGAERVLEIGPGSGVYIPVLKEVAAEVYLSDCEPAYLAAISEIYGADPTVRILIDDITASSVESEKFDLVLCTEVVEHVFDSKSALQNIARIMKPHGVLILSTPQRFSTLEMTARIALSPAFIWLTRLLYREPVLEMGHINLLTDAALRKQLDCAALEVMEQHKSGLYIPGIAELLGKAGLRLEMALEARLRGSRYDGVLWTQYYVAQRRYAR